MRAELWPITCSARSRSRVPPASSRPRGRASLVTVSRAAAVPAVAAAACGDVVDGHRADSRVGGDGPVGAAEAEQPDHVVAGCRRVSGWAGLPGVLRVMSAHRLGLGIGLERARPPVRRAESRVRLISALVQAGLPGGDGQRAQVGRLGRRPGRGWRPRTGPRCGFLLAGGRPSRPAGSGRRPGPGAGARAAGAAAGSSSRETAAQSSWPCPSRVLTSW